jgi:RNA polymerase sigma-70 factor (ECF subfamily)
VGNIDHRPAYEDLLRRYLPALKRLAWSYAPDQIDDLVQEIALRLWKGLPGFRGDSSEKTWLYRVAHNTAIDFVTGHHRRAKREQAGEPADVAAASASPESAAIDEQQRRRLRAAIEALPLIDRQVVVLHLEGLSAAEIEDVTGLSAGNVATRLTRARQRLAARVRGEDA